MSRRKVTLPKTQREISQEQITPYDQRGKGPGDTSKRREYQRSVKDSDVKRFNVGLQDIDETIVYYFNNVIKPTVVQNGNKLNVPILYGSPERWASVQKDGFYRDKNGKIQTPLIMFKRDSIEKNRTLGNKLDANNPVNFGIFKRNFSKKNVYDKFSLLTDRVPVEEYYGVIIPDYVTLEYSCIIFTNYIEQMNKIVEAINFASDSYWGDPERFSFRAMIDSYTTTTELSQGQDRVVKTNFTITMMGHIVPDSINAEIAGMNRFFSKSRVTFQLETEGNLETLTAKAGTPERDKSTRFFDTDTIGRTAGRGLTDEQFEFLRVNSTAVADSVTTNTATFENHRILDQPADFTGDAVRFQLFINGQAIPSINYTVSGLVDDIVVLLDTDAIGYTLFSTDQIILTGKFIPLT
jgi:hypothetical protein